jgi:hypothetical protein
LKIIPGRDRDWGRLDGIHRSPASSRRSSYLRNLTMIGTTGDEQPCPPPPPRRRPKSARGSKAKSHWAKPNRQQRLTGRRTTVCLESSERRLSQRQTHFCETNPNSIAVFGQTNGHDAGATPNPMKIESIRSRDCRSRFSPLESGPIIQAPHVTSNPVERYIEQ